MNIVDAIKERYHDGANQEILSFGKPEIILVHEGAREEFDQLQRQRKAITEAYGAISGSLAAAEKSLGRLIAESSNPSETAAVLVGEIQFKQSQLTGLAAALRFIDAKTELLCKINPGLRR